VKNFDDEDEAAGQCEEGDGQEDGASGAITQPLRVEQGI